MILGQIETPPVEKVNDMSETGHSGRVFNPTGIGQSHTNGKTQKKSINDQDRNVPVESVQDRGTSKDQSDEEMVPKACFIDTSTILAKKGVYYCQIDTKTDQNDKGSNFGSFWDLRCTF